MKKQNNQLDENGRMNMANGMNPANDTDVAVPSGKNNCSGIFRSPDGKTTIEIRDVWEHNLEEEMNNIRNLIDRYIHTLDVYRITWMEMIKMMASIQR